MSQERPLEGKGGAGSGSAPEGPSAAGGAPRAGRAEEGSMPGEAQQGSAASCPAGEAVSVPTSAEHQELVKKAGERDLYREELLRAKADFANYQKRVIRDRPQFEELAVRRFIIDLLPVLDNYDRALSQDGATLEGLVRGIEIVREMLIKALSSHGIEEIDALGKPFDPLFHEAVGQEETREFPPDTVCEVVEKGYTHYGTVVRPAKVKVARAPSEVAPSGAEEEGRQDP